MKDDRTETTVSDARTDKSRGKNTFVVIVLFVSNFRHLKLLQLLALCYHYLAVLGLIPRFQGLIPSDCYFLSRVKVYIEWSRPNIYTKHNQCKCKLSFTQASLWLYAWQPGKVSNELNARQSEIFTEFQLK